MPLRNALDRLTLGRKRGRSQGTAQPAGDLATGSAFPEESSLPAQIPGPSTPRGDRVGLVPPLSTTTGSHTPPIQPTIPRAPEHPTSAFILGRGTTEGAAGHVDDESAALDSFGMMGSEEGNGLGISNATPPFSAGTALSESTIQRHPLNHGASPTPSLSRPHHQPSEPEIRDERLHLPQEAIETEHDPGRRNRDRPRERHVAAHGDTRFRSQGSSEQLRSLQWSDKDDDDEMQEQLVNQLPSIQPTTRGDARNREQIPKAWRVLGISESSDKPYRVLGIPNPLAQRTTPERSELLHPLTPPRRQHPTRVQIFADTARGSSSVQEDGAFLSRSHPHPHVVAPQVFFNRRINNPYISNSQLSVTSRPNPPVNLSNTAMHPVAKRRGRPAGLRVLTSSQNSPTPDHQSPTTMQSPISRNDHPTGIDDLTSTTKSLSRDRHDRRGIRREVLSTPFGSSSLTFTNTNTVYPSMVEDPSRHQQGEASGSVGVLNTSSQHQARTHTVPILPSRFVSSSNFVEGHPGFRQPGFGLQQTSLQQIGFRQNSFQQNSFQQNNFHQSNAQQSSFQQTNSQQSSFQQSGTRNMFDGSSSAETDETLRKESPRRQQNQQSRTRNAFDGSSSAGTPSSQRRDVHNMSYSDLLPPLQSTGRRIDEEVGSSLADNSDDGSVSNFHGDPTLSIPLLQRSTPVTVVSRIPQSMRLPPPPPAEAQTSSETLMYPPHPRYQHTYSIAEDENDRRMIAPDYRYLPSGTATRRDAHDEPVEGTMASYTHPHPLRRPTPNPFLTPPPRLILGGRSVVRDDEVMMGRNEVGQMQYANVGSAAAQIAARNAAGDEILRAADEAAIEAADAAIASRHRYHRSDKSATSTEAEPPTTAPTKDLDGGVRRPAIRESILERHRQDLTAMGLLNPTRPLPAHVRPSHTFETEEPAHWARGGSRGSAAFAAALGLMRGLRRMPDEEEMVSVPMGHYLLVEGPPRLLQTARAYHACLAEKQEMTSKAIFVLCGVFPPAWLLYACGGFDWYMRHVTRGAVEKMSAVWRKRAWFLGVVWGLVTVVVFADILILCR